MMNNIKKAAFIILICTFILGCSVAYGAVPDISNTVIAAGNKHSMALRSDGCIMVWGSNNEGQLGLEKNIAKCETPVELKTSFKATAITAGYNFSAAIDSSGDVYIWGGRTNGNNIWTPTKVWGLTNIVAIEAGQKRLIALDKNGLVYEYNYNEQINPQRVVFPYPVVDISAGGDFYLVVDYLGDVYAWGDNRCGQLGDGTTTTSANPKKIKSLKGIVGVGAGNTHSLAVDENGNVWSWGSNELGELGLGTDTGNKTTPSLVSGVSDVVEVSAGDGGSLAKMSNGFVYVWGSGEFGQFGFSFGRDSVKTGTYKDKTPKPEHICVPNKISNLLNVVQIKSGVYFNLCLDKNGRLYSWGKNHQSELGNSNEAMEIKQGVVISNITTGSYHENIMLNGASDWAKSELNDFYNRNLLPIYPWISYKFNLTRGEFAAILVDVYEAKTNKTVSAAQTKFTDIGSSPYKTKINKAVTLKIVNGKSNKIFDPNGYLTRQEAAKMISIFSSVINNNNLSLQRVDLHNYNDESQIDSWAAPYVSYVTKNNIMKGSTDKKFHPHNKLTKEEGLLIVARLAAKGSWKG